MIVKIPPEKNLWSDENLNSLIALSLKHVVFITQIRINWGLKIKGVNEHNGKKPKGEKNTKIFFFKNIKNKMGEKIAE